VRKAEGVTMEDGGVSNASLPSVDRGAAIVRRSVLAVVVVVVVAIDCRPLAQLSVLGRTLTAQPQDKICHTGATVMLH
jgi:hypothetical protein